MNVREFFDAHGNDKKKCKLLSQYSPQILEGWEKETASSLSLGVVANEEILFFQIVDPTHYITEQGELTPKAFDAAQSHGLSVNRIKYASCEDLIKSAERRAAKYNEENPTKKQRKLWGFARFVAGKIRSIPVKSDGPRGLFIFDTAEPDNISHAEICESNSGKHDFRSLRSALFDAANEALYNLDQFRNDRCPKDCPKSPMQRFIDLLDPWVSTVLGLILIAICVAAVAGR